MNTQLASMNELTQLGDVFVKSGFFTDSKSAAQSIVKILAGRELGFGPVASMTGVYIVSGKPALSSNLIGARIKGSGRYDYRVTTLTETQCTIDFFQVNGSREKIGTSTFTLDDAKRAGTKNLDRFPRNMLFARALTNGARWFCPDVFNGAVYTPDELGAEVETNADGEIIQVIEQPHQIESPEQITDNSPVIASSRQPVPSRDDSKRVKVKITASEYPKMLIRIGELPYYNANGKPDTCHIIGAVGKCGYTEITDANIAEIEAVLRDYAVANTTQETR